MTAYVLAFDASTTSVKAILFDKSGTPVAESALEFEQHYPKQGWVEHDPEEIWVKQIECARNVIAESAIEPTQIAAIGITNQRETTVVWDRLTGQPIHKAICWQDRRTAQLCEELRNQGYEQLVKKSTGLVIDSYFSATKIAWILDNVEGARDRANRGELAAGTIDSWLIWNLTGGDSHVTDVSNASRTLLFDIVDYGWSKELLSLFRVPLSMLPEIRTSSEIYGLTVSELLGAEIPVASSAGDQQASLFGQACFDKGLVKCTYGTGASLMMNTGSEPVFSENGLLTTVACQVGENRQYAIEGLIFVSAQALKWLRDDMQLVQSVEETDEISKSVPDTDGVYFVSALSGLAVPYWDPYARGTLIGMSLRTKRAHIVRAAVESVAYQIADCIEAMSDESGIQIQEIRADGGAAQNTFLMQFQADLLGSRITKSPTLESTARGAAFLAGLAVGFWASIDELRDSYSVSDVYAPVMDRGSAATLHAGWARAVERSREWARP